MGSGFDKPRHAALRVIVALVASVTAVATSVGETGAPPDSPIVLDAGSYRVRIDPAGFRYGIERRDGTVIAGPHAESGLQILREGRGGAVVSTSSVRSDVARSRRDGSHSRWSRSARVAGDREDRLPSFSDAGG